MTHKLRADGLDSLGPYDPYTIDVALDGNLWSALTGNNIQEGTVGFGRTVADAIADLAVQVAKAGGYALGVDGCQCESCKLDGPHMSDCSVHSEPAMPKGKCDCGLQDQKDKMKAEAKTA